MTALPPAEDAPPEPKGWRAVAQAGRMRIFNRVWAPGGPIPSEAQLAEEFGVSRATVNRALRELAEEGWIERKRRAGSRVALHPVRRTRFDVPLIRQQVEASGRRYGYRLLSREEMQPAPPEIERKMELGTGAVLALSCLHLADDAPFAHEERWIGLTMVWKARKVDFTTVSPNEWLLREVPFDHVEVAVSAEGARSGVAKALGCKAGAPLLVLERITYDLPMVLTYVRLSHAPGHRMWSD